MYGVPHCFSEPFEQMLGPNSWRRPSRSGSPSAQPHRDRSRSRSRDRHASCANDLGEAHRRRSDHDRAHADARGRPDRLREEDPKRSASDYTDHCARPSSLSHRRAGDDSDRRPDAQRAGDDDWPRERLHDERRAYASQRRTDSLVDSRRRDEGYSEPRRDRQGFASRQQDCRKIATATNQDTIGHRIGTLCWRLRTARSGERIANPRAATPATVAGHPESRSN